MDYEKIKKDANNILANLSSECSYIEYKASASQLGKSYKLSVHMEIITMITKYSTFFLGLKK